MVKTQPRIALLTSRVASQSDSLIAEHAGQQEESPLTASKPFDSDPCRSLKNELVHHCDFASLDEARAAIFDYIELFYNRRRIHQTIGYKTPAQFERKWAAS